MENRTPDILAELREIETGGGQPWEPEPFGKFSATLSVASRKFAAHLMLESNLFSGMAVKMPIKFDDFPAASALFGEGAEFVVTDRGCRCLAKVIEIYPHPEKAARPADGSIGIGAPPSVVHVDDDRLSAPKEDWVPPAELVHRTPRQCGPTSTYYARQAYCVLSALATLALFAVILGSPFLKMHALKVLQGSGTPVDGTITSAVLVAGRATTKGSTPAHFMVAYSYAVTDNGQRGTKTGLYQGNGGLIARSYSAAQISPGKTIPVVYDPSEPQRSMLTDDLELREYTFVRVAGICLTILCIGFPSLFAWAIYRAYLEERRLLAWGQVAGAKLSEKKLATKRVNTWIATYAFRDNRGMLVKFSQYKKADEIGQLAEQETILFDPHDSAVAAIYPLKMVALP